MLQKLEKTLFFIFLILIPFQLRIFVRSNPAVVGEWNSFFIYLGDVIFFLVFLLFLNRIKKTRIVPNLKFWLLLIFVLIAFISIFISSATKISIFRWLKLIEVIILYIYINYNFQFSIFNFQTKKNILSVLFYSGVAQSILAIAQFVKNSSIGIKFIEAGVFDPNSPGVANFILNGERILRSYGSFSHPNVLAGFLLLTIFCGYKILLIANFKHQNTNYKQIQNPKFKIQNLVIISCVLIIIMGLFLTFSRTAIAVFIFGNLMMFLIDFFKLRRLEHTEQRLKDGKTLTKLFVLVVVSCILVVILLFPYLKARFFTISMEEQAVDLRFFYNRMAIQMIKEKPILGIGIGNFAHYSENYPIYAKAALKIIEGNTSQIPGWIYQPVHNIYLLIASEMGVLGLLVFLGIVGMILLDWFKNCFLSACSASKLSCVAGGVLVGCFLVIALTDHYFWTLQSGTIMFWLALALIKSE